jgi:hypothetical protein
MDDLSAHDEGGDSNDASTGASVDIAMIVNAFESDDFWLLTTEPHMSTSQPQVERGTSHTTGDSAPLLQPGVNANILLEQQGVCIRFVTRLAASANPSQFHVHLLASFQALQQAAHRCMLGMNQYRAQPPQGCKGSLKKTKLFQLHKDSNRQALPMTKSNCNFNFTSNFKYTSCNCKRSLQVTCHRMLGMNHHPTYPPMHGVELTNGFPRHRDTNQQARSISSDSSNSNMPLMSMIFIPMLSFIHNCHYHQ